MPGLCELRRKCERPAGRRAFSKTLCVGLTQSRMRVWPMQHQPKIPLEPVSSTIPSPHDQDGYIITDSSPSGETSGPLNLASFSSTTTSSPAVRRRMSLSEVISEMKASKEPPSSNLRQMVTVMQTEEALQRLKAANASEDALCIFPLQVKAHGLATANWLVTNGVWVNPTGALGGHSHGG